MLNKNQKGKFTGRHFLIITLSFFGVIFAMNFYMAYMAFSTFTGLDVNNSYHKGRLYNEVFDAAKKQAANHWQVDLKYERTGKDKMLVVVNTKDKNGKPLTGLDVLIKLRRPTQAHMDQKAALHANGIGSYKGLIALPLKGQWDLILLARNKDKEHYKSIQRIILK